MKISVAGRYVIYCRFQHQVKRKVKWTRGFLFSLCVVVPYVLIRLDQHLIVHIMLAEDCETLINDTYSLTESINHK